MYWLFENPYDSSGLKVRFWCVLKLRLDWKLNLINVSPNLSIDTKHIHYLVIYYPLGAVHLKERQKMEVFFNEIKQLQNFSQV